MGFTMSLQWSLDGIIAVYKMLNDNVSNVGVHECYNAVIIILCMHYANSYSSIIISALSGDMAHII